MKIPFNKTYLSGKELNYIKDTLRSGHISSDGDFTKKCHDFFENKYHFQKAFLMTSCTSALELSAALIEIKKGDEIIIPSYSFVSTANAFAIRGAKIIFCDSEFSSPNIDTNQIEKLITARTKAIALIHYAGIACKMDKVLELCKKHNLYLVEDAAHALDSFYNNFPLGSLGNFGTFSFHETKNITAGECGLITVNDERFIKTAEIMRDKGTNRTAFFRGEINKYEWVNLGSSYAPSEITAAFLFAQIENLVDIQKKRISLWERYYSNLKKLSDSEKIKLPVIPGYASNSAHIFYFMCRNIDERTSLIRFLKENGISSSFHYLALHNSPYFKSHNEGLSLPNAEMFTDCLIRLPMFYELKFEEIDYISDKVYEFYKN